jgi:hypothetical protein
MRVGSADPNTRLRCADPDHEGERRVPLFDFAIHKVQGKHYYRSYCRTCEARKRRNRRRERMEEEGREAVIKAERERRDRWLAKPENQDAERSYSRTYYARNADEIAKKSKSPHGKALRRKHDKSPKGQARFKRQQAKQKAARLRGRALLPTEVVKPFLDLLVREAGGNALEVDSRFGLPRGMVYDHVRLHQKTANPTLVDRLTTDTTLCSEVELRDRADEWAVLTGHDWPGAKVYHRKQPVIHMGACAGCGASFRLSVPQNTRHKKGLPVFHDQSCSSRHNRNLVKAS